MKEFQGFDSSKLKVTRIHEFWGYIKKYARLWREFCSFVGLFTNLKFLSWTICTFPKSKKNFLIIIKISLISYTIFNGLTNINRPNVVSGFLFSSSDVLRIIRTAMCWIRKFGEFPIFQFQIYKYINIYTYIYINIKYI